MNGENKKPSMISADTAILYQNSDAQETRVDPITCEPATRGTAGRRLLFQDTVHCDHPLRDIPSSSSTTKHGWGMPIERERRSEPRDHCGKEWFAISGEHSLSATSTGEV